MAYRTILVVVDGTPAGQPRVERALLLAARFNASITGVFLKSEIIPPALTGDGFAVTPGDIIQQFVDDRDRETARLSAAARSAFEGSARAAGLTFAWRDINGDFDDALVACARRHDLSILPPVMKPALTDTRLTAAHIGLASGAPVLVAPEGKDFQTLGRRVLVAWKEAREAARALHDAWPFLEEAESVTFLTVSKSAQSSLDADLKASLSAHGCRNLTVVADTNEDADIGDVIRSQIRTSSADLVVLGLYGHSRLQEFILGGVSRNLLSHPPIPMLMSH